MKWAEMPGMPLFEGRIPEFVEFREVGLLFGAGITQMATMETQDFDRVDMPVVLLVDDNKDLLWLMSNFLERGGFMVHALDRAPTVDEVNTIAPVVVFLDVEIGSVNGMDTCLKIKGDPQLAKTPVFLVSSHAKDKLEQEAERCNADGYFQKPVEPGVLIDLAQRYAEKRNAA